MAQLIVFLPFVFKLPSIKSENACLAFLDNIVEFAKLDIKLKDSKKIIETYFETYPGIKIFMENTLSKAREKGYVETLLGRRRYADGLTSTLSLIHI